MYEQEVRVLKKIQNNQYDDEVKAATIQALQWYQDHADELLED